MASTFSFTNRVPYLRIMCRHIITFMVKICFKTKTWVRDLYLFLTNMFP